MTGAECPTLTVDSRDVRMRARSRPDAAFPVLVCEAPVPKDARSVRLAQETLPAVPADPARVLVIGDTGCRIKADPASGGVLAQDCSDLRKWPFARIAEVSAALEPDLIVHVGDYHYREAACPASDARCAGSIPGDAWESWRQDFFAPVGPLLRAAPWIFARGNHESCERAGAGFMRLLAPGPLRPDCPAQDAPYTVRLGALQLVVLDSARADVTAAQVSALSALPLRDAWLVSHRPLWAAAAPSGGALESDRDEDDLEEAAPSSDAAARVGVPKGVGLVLAGHRHLFEVMTFADGRAPQLIGGNSGTMLAKSLPDLRGAAVDGTTVRDFRGADDFGFMTLERRTGGSWLIRAFDSNGAATLTCALAPSPGGPSRLDCGR